MKASYEKDSFSEPISLFLDRVACIYQVGIESFGLLVRALTNYDEAGNFRISAFFIPETPHTAFLLS